ncbi:MAG: ZIP family metal transporter [Gemmatimonadales bacterium]|nr:ZIP family metal transporter [Gemmatimonadales bacterium]NIN11046.1 ZIP family metal transporter [Gemmatimonadales bacterium]NIN49643.1 ZIP family metal transporter [Gemmatimonadales bacterium]NIP07107.1 ZIP family metal transporter [Gemmatimonadales bacterium]NIQ99498.1 ZIP family metal transporter [Gemmatimonadales bacterium]
MVSARAVAYANAVASGLMLGASFGLVAEGTRHGSWQTIGGAIVGVAFILATQRFLGRYDIQFGTARGAGARRVTLVLVVMTAHSFAEGVAVGVAFGGGMTLAAVITAAIAVHNIPEGLAISAVLRPRNVSVFRCAAWSIASSLPQPLMAVPAFLFVETFATALPYGMGFAAGAMVVMVFVELLPEAYEQARKPTVALLVSVTLVAMVLFQQYL